MPKPLKRRTRVRLSLMNETETDVIAASGGKLGRAGKGPRVATGVMLCLTVGAAAAIFVLTSQDVDTTSAESSWMNDLLIRLFGDIPGLYDPETGLWLGLSVRQWAHTAEFLMLGTFVSLSVSLLRKGGPLGSSIGIAAAVCAACSIADQMHKLFVPGRHFDGVDLGMDALGYGTAIAVVFIVVALLRRR